MSGDVPFDIRRVSKRFGAALAVSDVSLAVTAGRLHAVVGENGAGKSTLLKIGAGILPPDRGEVWIGGQRLAPHTAAAAIRRGVAMVQQHFALIDVFTVLENLVLGCEPLRGAGVLDLGRARARLAEVLRDLGGELDPDAPVATLSVGDRQRLEIARALFRDARVVVLDEPTAVLTPLEADALYGTLRRLTDRGKAVVVVTHKLDEVRDHADDVTVLRRGERVLSVSLPPGERADIRAIAEAIMGGAAPSAPHAPRAPKEAVVLDVVGLRLLPRLRGVSMRLRAGEIVGVAGIEGNGQSELLRVLAGLAVPDGGRIVADGGISVAHEDRQREGLVLDASVRDNLLLGELARFSRYGLLDRRALESEARSRLEKAGIVPPDLDRPARDLSGGNQQKIVVARAVARTPACRVLALAHPTRGVDLRASAQIHDQIRRAAAAGVGVLVIGADLGELRALSDRILVLSRGAIVGELSKAASDREIGEAMLGAGAVASPEPRP